MTGTQRRSTLTSQAGTFLAIGVFCAVLDYLTTITTMHGGLDHLWGKTCGFLVGTTVAYLLNSRYTFGAAQSWARFGAVMTLYALTFAVQIGIWHVCWLLFSSWGWSETLIQACGFVIAQGTATVVNFLVQRYGIFRS